MKIYKITTPHSTKCYVGKTTAPLKRRFKEHRGSYHRWLDMKVSWCSSYGLLLLGDCSIELLEETEDSQAEGKWITQIDTVNNTLMKSGVGDQYDQPTASRLYRGANLEKILAKDRAYHHAHKDKRNAMRLANHYANRDKNLIKLKAYYEANKESECAKKRERIICDRCGIEISRAVKARHQRSKRCQTLYAAKLHLQ